MCMPSVVRNRSAWRHAVEVRLTYEDLVDTQTELLKNLADLEVEQREVARLQEVTQSVLWPANCC